MTTDTSLPDPNSLWEQLKSGKFQKAASAAARARKAGKREAAASILSGLGLSTPPPRPSPWKAIAVSLPVSVTVCKCGAVHRTPAGSPLVRFLHRRNGTIWEVPEHPARFNTSLPREIKELRSTTEWCEECFAPAPSDSPAQMDLFTIYIDSAGTTRAGLIEKHIAPRSGPTLSDSFLPPKPHLQVQYIYPRSRSRAPAPYSAGALVPFHSTEEGDK